MVSFLIAFDTSVAWYPLEHDFAGVLASLYFVNTNPDCVASEVQLLPGPGSRAWIEERETVTTQKVRGFPFSNFSPCSISDSRQLSIAIISALRA